MTVFDALEEWADAADRVGDWLGEPAVTASVIEVADALQSRKSGTIWGTTVERICAAHGLSPVAGPPRPPSRARRRGPA